MEPVLCLSAPVPEVRLQGRPLGSLATRGALRASRAEVESNPRARSARLRSWRKAA